MRRNPGTDRGATAIEYALLIGLVGMVLVVGVAFVGARMSTSFTSAGTALTGAGTSQVLADGVAGSEEQGDVDTQAAEEAQAESDAEARAAEEAMAADEAKDADEAKAAELRALEEAKAAEGAQAGMSDEERAKLAEQAKAQAEADAKAKGPKPVLVKGVWTCPNKWTAVDKGECVKG